MNRTNEDESLMNQDVITSTANPLIKRIRALEQKKQRRAEGAFFVEGIRPVWLAVEREATVETLIVAPDLLTSDAARQMVEQQQRAGVRVAEVSRSVFESIAERDNPSGLAAIIRTPSPTLADLKVEAGSLFIALYEVGNPGNLGTIIRTADAVGAAGVLLLGEATDPYHPTAVKASMGTLFSVPVVATTTTDLIAWTAQHTVSIYPTSDQAEAVHWQVSYQLPALLLFGSEGQGLPGELLGRGQAVRIPMQGAADSLNLAVAAGVLMFEVSRQLAAA